MFGFSGEHILVLLIILLIFGPKRLPDLGHSVGRTLKNFKDAMNGLGTEPTPVPPASQLTVKAETVPPAAATAPTVNEAVATPHAEAEKTETKA